MKRSWRECIGVGTCVLCVCSALLCRGDVIIGLQDWDTDPLPAAGVGLWEDDNATVTLSRQIDGDGYLDISLSGAASSQQVTVKVPSAELFAGGWNETMWVAFDFWADEPDNALSLVWSPADSSDVWALDLSSPAGGANSEAYRASLDYDSGWSLLGGGPQPDLTQFLSDLDSIDWIGLYIEQAATGAEGFGLDNLQLMVPEPGEWAFLGCLAMLASVWLIRSRRELLVA